MATTQADSAPESKTSRVISIRAIVGGLLALVAGYIAIDGSTGYLVSIAGAVLAAGGLTHLGSRHIRHGDGWKASAWFSRALALLCLGGARYCEYLRDTQSIDTGAAYNVLIILAGVFVAGEAVLRVAMRSKTNYNWYTKWRSSNK